MVLIAMPKYRLHVYERKAQRRQEIDMARKNISPSLQNLVETSLKSVNLKLNEIKMCDKNSCPKKIDIFLDSLK